MFTLHSVSNTIICVNSPQHLLNDFVTFYNVQILYIFFISADAQN
jgi:hypothetical protein